MMPRWHGGRYAARARRTPIKLHFPAAPASMDRPCAAPSSMEVRRAPPISSPPSSSARAFAQASQPFSVTSTSSSSRCRPLRAPAWITWQRFQSGPIRASSCYASWRRLPSPAIPFWSFPAAATPAGLPIGFQLVASPMCEPLLLRTGHAFQMATNWHRRRPSGITAALSDDLQSLAQ